MYAILYVDHEEYHVCLTDRQLHLTVYLTLKNIFRVLDKASGIHDGKFDAVPQHLTVVPVAGDSALFVNDGITALGHSVEES